MLVLGKGAYLGKVLDLSQADGILAGVTSYRQGDGAGLMHYHENSHLSFVLRGGGVEKRKSSEFERLPGQIMFFHAGESHQCVNKLFPARNVNLEIENAFLRDNGLSEAAVNLSVLKNPNSKFIMLKVYKELLTEDDFSSSSIKMLLLNLICGNQKTCTVKGLPLWVNIIKEMLNDRWNEQLSLKDLSEATGVHSVTISKFFPKYFSCTFGEYMRRLKIEKSLQLIKTSSDSLTEIAQECGFSDQSHFTRTFKQLTGFLPNQYAKL
jgi:AraC-type DNA-binding domain-containing proteins